MKSLFSSLTIKGVAITLICYVLSLLNPSVDRQELHGIIDGIMHLWPTLLGIATALGAAWHRLQAWHFEKSMLRSKTFWAGIVSAVLALMHAFQMPTDGLQDLADQIFAAVAEGGPLLGSILIVIGRIRAKKPIEVRRATPVSE